MPEPVAFNDEARRILTAAQALAPVAVSGPHMLLAILADRECGAARLLPRYGVDIVRLQQGAEWLATTIRYSDDAPDGFSAEAHYLITQALALARLDGHTEAGTEHLLYAIATEPLSGASELLDALGFDRTSAMLALSASYHSELRERAHVGALDGAQGAQDGRSAQCLTVLTGASRVNQDEVTRLRHDGQRFNERLPCRCHSARRANRNE